MSFLRQILSANTVSQIESFQERFSENLQHAQEKYLEFENAICEELRPHIPNHLQPLIRKVMRTIPQHIFCLTVVSGLGNALTSLYWAAHAVWVVLPIFSALAQGREDGEVDNSILLESKQRIQELYEQFKPVIFVSCAVGAVAFAVAGFFTLQMGMFVHATGLAAIAALAYQAIDFTVLAAEQTPLAPTLAL